MDKKFIQVETKAGEPVAYGDLRLIPMSRSVRFGLPGMKGGFIWNRPVSVAVVDQAGNEAILPVHDVTRLIQIAILGSGLLAGVWFFTRKR